MKIGWNPFRKIKAEKIEAVPIRLDPKLQSAYTIKGAAVLERGVQEFASWSNEMVNEFGESIRPHLQRIWSDSQTIFKSNQTEMYSIAGKKRNASKAIAGTTPAEGVIIPEKLVWNAALDIATALVKGGASISDAVDKAIVYIKSKTKENFNEQITREMVVAVIQKEIGNPEAKTESAALTTERDIDIASSESRDAMKTISVLLRIVIGILVISGVLAFGAWLTDSLKTDSLTFELLFFLMCLCIGLAVLAIVTIGVGDFVWENLINRKRVTTPKLLCLLVGNLLVLVLFASVFATSTTKDSEPVWARGIGVIVFLLTALGICAILAWRLMKQIKRIGKMMEKIKRIGAKNILLCGAVAFILCGLFPPWQYTADRNGEYGFHSSKPAGYSLIFHPPKPQDNGAAFGVKIDFGRLLLEWAALAAATGMVWVLVVKPAWSRNDKANHPQKFIPPPDNSQN